MPEIPFATLPQRHLVYAYIAVLTIHAIYAVNLLYKFHKPKSNPTP